MKEVVKRKTVDFGKIDFSKVGRKTHRATVDIELRNLESGKVELSMSGMVWNTRETDIVMGGQCLDDMASYLRGNKMFRTLYRLWKLHHLNGMHPECEHQRELGWAKMAMESIETYVYKQKTETYKKISEIKDRTVRSVMNGETVTPSEEDVFYLNLPLRLSLQTNSLPDEYKDYYIFSKKEENKRGWTRFNEDDRGILSKPCPVCDYKYGSEWRYKPIPDEDMKLILEILES